MSVKKSAVIAMLRAAIERENKAGYWYMEYDVWSELRPMMEKPAPIIGPKRNPNENAIPITAWKERRERGGKRGEREWGKRGGKRVGREGGGRGSGEESREGEGRGGGGESREGEGKGGEGGGGGVTENR